MISTPQEIEQNAMTVANWIAYMNRPYVFPTQDGQKVYLTVLSEEEFNRLNTPINNETEE